MSNISSIASYVPAVSAAKSSPTNYESNVAAYGSLIAGAVGVAEAAGAGASAVCVFSTESLDKLGDVVEAGYEAIGDAVDGVESLVGNTIDGVETVVGDAVNLVEDGATNLYTEIADMAGSGLDAIGDAASAVAGGFGSVANGVSTLAGYGLAAGKQVISELV